MSLNISDVYELIYDRYVHQSFNNEEPNLYIVINNVLGVTETDLIDFYVFIKENYPRCPVTSHVHFMYKDTDEFKAARLLGII